LKQLKAGVAMVRRSLGLAIRPGVLSIADDVIV
jgi:hypothetical protein